MCFWGEALATGPNINVTSNGKAVMSDEERQSAYVDPSEVVGKMQIPVWKVRLPNTIVLTLPWNLLPHQFSTHLPSRLSSEVSA